MQKTEEAKLLKLGGDENMDWGSEYGEYVEDKITDTDYQSIEIEEEMHTIDEAIQKIEEAYLEVLGNDENMDWVNRNREGITEFTG